jgi:hypothetical protein
VRDLQVENLAADADVFIQGGDIVKGGRQDRVLAHDLIVPPKSGKVPAASFCVEAGRWHRRGWEDAARFSQSSSQLPGKALRLAVGSSRQQRLVWKQVKAQQDRLSRRLNRLVASAASPSSLQLTLEDKALQAQVSKYVHRLKKCVAGKDDVIGVAVAVNGRVDSAEIYASSTLFRAMWPKLLRTAAVTAFAEQIPGRRFERAEADDVLAFLADRGGRRTETKISNRFRVIQHDGPLTVTFETRDDSRKGAMLHRSVIAR